MKEKIIRVIIFFLILILLMIIISYPFIPKNNSAEAGMHDPDVYGILGEPDNTIDVIIYGDSESITSFIPLKMWNEYGYTSYICGTAGQVMPAVVKAILKTTKNQAPKYIILETNNMFIPAGISAPLAKIANSVFPVLEYHDRWKELKTEDIFGKINYTKTRDDKGYHYMGEVTPIDDAGYMAYSEDIQEIAIEHQMYVELIKKYCDSKEIELILMSAPNTKNWTYQKHNGLDMFCKKTGIEYIDFNIITKEIGIDWSQDTGDYGEHVNINGARKVTSYLGKYLHSKGKLMNHKNDRRYGEWNKLTGIY